MKKLKWLGKFDIVIPRLNNRPMGARLSPTGLKEIIVNDDEANDLLKLWHRYFEVDIDVKQEA